MIPAIPQSLSRPANWLAAGILLLCIVLQLAGLVDELRYDRDLIANGQPWRLLSGNFVHLGSGHLLMNLLGFALVVALVWQHFNALEWLLLIVFTSLAVGIGLYVRDSSVGWYVGFSGTLHGLIVAGCIADFRVYPRSAALLLILIVGKLLWEQYAGALPGSESMAGGRVVVNAHLYGAIGGAAAGSLLSYRQRRAHTLP